MNRVEKRETIHIIGAGVAGLAAAFYAGRAGGIVRVYEASPFAGGRCRSFHDKQLDATIDNGNHLLLGANMAALELIRELGAEKRFHRFTGGMPFVDVRDGSRWQLPPSGSIMKLAAAVPGVTPWGACAGVARLFIAGKVGGMSPFHEKLLHPLAVSILNTPPEKASARMLKSLLLELQRAEDTTAYVPAQGWGDALIAPLLEAIAAQGGSITYGCRVSALHLDAGRIFGFTASQDVIPVAAGERVIIATPPWVVEELLPEVRVPTEHMPIVNVHFKSSEFRVQSSVTGIVGGAVEWVFAHGGILSTTTSAALDLVQEADETTARKVWADVCRALAFEQALPPYRVIREKRATFACTKENLGYRPATRTAFSNLFLAGDYTDTGLPSTLEGAVASGKKAASAAA